MSNELDELERMFEIPFGLLPGLPRGQALCGKTEGGAIKYLQERGWYEVSIWQDYRCLLRHPSGYSILLILEMDERDGDMIVMGIGRYSAYKSS